MTRRWDTLILPPFESGQMADRKNRPKGQPRKLNSRAARSLMTWSHYQFSVHVKAAFLRAGKEVVSPDERYTTMCCGSCGILGEKHSLEQWTCKRCGAFHARDPAASRCIFLKALAPRAPPPSPAPAAASGDATDEGTEAELRPDVADHSSLDDPPCGEDTSG